MLDNGNAPDDWSELLKTDQKEQARLDEVIKRKP